MFRFCLGALVVAQISMASSASAAGCGFLGLGKCKSIRGEAVAAADFSENALVQKPTIASYSYNEFQFLELADEAALGYTGVEFSFRDKSLSKYSDRFQNATQIADRSLLDWLKSIFNTTEKTFIISIDVYEDGTESKLLAHRPIYIARYTDSLKSIKSESLITIEDEIGFFRPSDESTFVKLNVRYANSSDVSLQQIDELLDVVGEVAESVPSVSGLVAEGTLLTLQAKIGELNNLLGRFEVATEMSRGMQLKQEKGAPFGFVYDFFAPNEPTPRVKLYVGLKYRSSLLIAGGTTNTFDILRKQVHLSDTQSQSVRLFIETSPRSADAIRSLYTPSPNIRSVCRKVKEALSEKLIGDDVLVAFNSYVTENSDLFEKGWDARCFTTQNREVLKNLEFQAFDPEKIFSEEREPLEMSLDDQLRAVSIVNSVIRSSLGKEDVKLQGENLALRLFDDRAIEIVDEVGMLAGVKITIQAKPEDLVSLFSSSEIPFERSLQCFSGKIRDEEYGLNTVGALTLAEGKPVEVLFEYEDSPVSPKSAILERVTIRDVSNEDLLKYRDAHPDRTEKGCGRLSFKPWELTNSDA